MSEKANIDTLRPGLKYEFRIEIDGVEIAFYGYYYGVDERNRFMIAKDWLSLIVEPRNLVLARRVSND